MIVPTTPRAISAARLTSLIKDLEQARKTHQKCCEDLQREASEENAAERARQEGSIDALGYCIVQLGRLLAEETS